MVTLSALLMNLDLARARRLTPQAGEGGGPEWARFRGSRRELIPVGPQKVRLRLPAGMGARNVRLLAADKPPPLKSDREYLTVTAPSVLDHEIVAVDLQPKG